MRYYSRTDIPWRIYIVLQQWQCNGTLLTEVFHGTLCQKWILADHEMYAKIFTFPEPLNTDVGELKIETGSRE